MRVSSKADVSGSILVDSNDKVYEKYLSWNEVKTATGMSDSGIEYSENVFILPVIGSGKAMWKSHSVDVSNIFTPAHVGFLPAGFLHSCYLPPNCQFFEFRLVGQSMAEELQKEGVDPSHETLFTPGELISNHWLRSMFLTMIGLSRSRCYSSIAQLEFAWSIMAWYTSPEKEKLKSDKSRQRTSLALEYIHANLNNPKLSLSAISAELGISMYRFAHVFKNELGISPHKYIMWQRISRAMHLLAAKKNRISDIAIDLGFSNAAHLSTAFSKHVGIKPSEYRSKV